MQLTAIQERSRQPAAVSSKLKNCQALRGLLWNNEKGVEAVPFLWINKQSFEIETVKLLMFHWLLWWGGFLLVLDSVVEVQNNNRSITLTSWLYQKALFYTEVFVTSYMI